MYRYVALDYAREFQELLDQRILDKKEKEIKLTTTKEVKNEKKSNKCR